MRVDFPLTSSPNDTYANLHRTMSCVGKKTANQSPTRNRFSNLQHKPVQNLRAALTCVSFRDTCARRRRKYIDPSMAMRWGSKCINNACKRSLFQAFRSKLQHVQSSAATDATSLVEFWRRMTLPPQTFRAPPSSKILKNSLAEWRALI